MGRHEGAARDAQSTNPTMNFGIVLHAMEQYGNLVHACAKSSYVVQTDFTYAAPIYKGNNAIKEGLEKATGSLEKFDVYFKNAILDDTSRARFSQQFRQQYLQKFPGSERSDLFLASGDVMKFAFELVQPHTLQNSAEALDAIHKTPHDPHVLARLRMGEAVDRAHLRVELKVFLDHVMNPRRREEPGVAKAALDIGTDDPYVIEMLTDGAIPGYLYYLVQPMVAHVGGRLVLLAGG